MQYVRFVAVLICAASLASAGCICAQPERTAASGARKSREVRIGFSMDTLKEERWQRDRDLFVARASELGAEVLVQAANGDDALQTAQAENLLTQGVDVLVVAPHNAEVAASIVDSAERQGVPVVSYDRLTPTGSERLYQKGTGMMVAPMMLSIRQDNNGFTLEAWVRCNLFMRISSFFILPPEIGIESGGFKAVLPRKIARDAVNGLLHQLGVPLIP